MNPGPSIVPGSVARHARRHPRHEGQWRGWTLTLRLAGAAGVAGVAVVAVAVTGWSPGSIGVLAGAVTVLAALIIRGPGIRGPGPSPRDGWGS